MSEAQISSKKHGFTSSSLLRENESLLWRAVQDAQNFSPLAQFVWKLRLLPLGVPGIKALARVPLTDFAALDWLKLPSPMPRHKRTGYALTVPNVFRDLSSQAHKDFLRAARDQMFFRGKVLAEWGFACARRFSLRALARIIESGLPIRHAPVLIRICNFRGEDARWPVELLPEGANWIACAYTPIRDRKPNRRTFPFPTAQSMVRDFSNWVNTHAKPGDQEPKESKGYEFLIPAKIMSPADTEACKIVVEIVRIARETGTPREYGSLARYLRAVLQVLLAQHKNRRPQRISAPLKEAHRLVLKARMRLGLPICNDTANHFRGPRSSPVLKLNLVPFRALESKIIGELGAGEDIATTTAKVLQIVATYTGRRLSDFGLTALGNLHYEAGTTDFTLPRTKAKHVRNIHLPLHRLLPKRALDFYLEWLRNITTLVESSILSADTTLYELVTGTHPPHAKEMVRNGLLRAFGKLWPDGVTRYHQCRYAFASFAPLAILIAWHPGITTHPLIQPWIAGSEFFGTQQRDNWQALLGTRTTNPFAIIRTVLGHANEHELEVDYCVSWPLLVLAWTIILDQGKG